MTVETFINKYILPRLSSRGQKRASSGDTACVVLVGRRGPCKITELAAVSSLLYEFKDMGCLRQVIVNIPVCVWHFSMETAAFICCLQTRVVSYICRHNTRQEVGQTWSYAAAETSYRATEQPRWISCIIYALVMLIQSLQEEIYVSFKKKSQIINLLLNWCRFCFLLVGDSMLPRKHTHTQVHSVWDF